MRYEVKPRRLLSVNHVGLFYAHKDGGPIVSGTKFKIRYVNGIAWNWRGRGRYIIFRRDVWK